MNSAIAAAITAVEQELEAIDEGYARERGELESTLGHLQRIGAKQDGKPPTLTARKSTPRRGKKIAPKKRGPYKAKKKTAPRKTDGRTDGARRVPVARSLPDQAATHAADILAAIAKAGGSIKPGELQRAVGANNENNSFDSGN